MNSTDLELYRTLANYTRFELLMETDSVINQVGKIYPSIKLSYIKQIAFRVLSEK